ncbi:E3 ubiquitin-protein ligase HOS1 [Argentina anserina]|uniref:E3 ubiquitin-protein ligase HOS1 n=1 Tax=Argentina anserina TaxID=57926 RepID=UPI0021762C46|nr:E3 ubiquitin-protein ligase HOS1 [Potentilla anserina]
MNRRINNGPTGPSSSTNGGSATRSGSRTLQPDYNSPAVQEALEQLASIDLIDLCNEAKVEHCRATRDLRSCGRYVTDVLNSCGHASLCAECSQRCDVCPICRIPILNTGARLRRRLYDQCSEARLISKRSDKRFQEKEDGEEPITNDVLRLYSLFDVALENNLASLICHYVTDVCLDESAVSSDPVIAFLLDEVVVKDWCKRAFQNITTELQVIYNFEAEEMKTMLGQLLKFSAQLAGISNVLEVLDLSFKGSLSSQLHDLHQLLETILKTKQHLEIMIWCIRHEFLKNVKPRHTDITTWHTLVCERKSAAVKRSWPDALNNSEESNGQEGSLFIEDALTNLETEQGDTMVEELKLAFAQKDGRSSVYKSKIEGIRGCYPFENVRAAVDVLFLCGSSDLVVAKQATFLYYLYDRHWTLPDEDWRHILEDFGATFGISGHLLLESLIFYLLDDHTDEALQEACHLLPEISGPATHPKIAQVLLERGNPDTALSVLRWSGRDGTSNSVSLGEAVTAVRVRVECGLFTEAFIHQRMLCTKFKEKKLKIGQLGGVTDDSNDRYMWEDWVEILVSEICFLCIRRNMIDRMIELPWNSNEEKHLHKCLLDYANGDSSSTIGSLLVVFYIQRYRYSEAYRVNQILQNLEQEFISKNAVSEEVLSRMKSVSGWRAGLIDKCMDLLPEVQRQQVKDGKAPEIATNTSSDVEMLETSIPNVQGSKSTSLLIPSSTDSSAALWTDQKTTLWNPAISETPQKRGGTAYLSEIGNFSPSGLHGRLSTYSETRLKADISIKKTFNFEDASTPLSRVGRAPAARDTNRSSSDLFSSYHLCDNQYGTLSPEVEHDVFLTPFQTFQNASPSHYQRITTNPVTTTSSNNGLFEDPTRNLYPNLSRKNFRSDRDVRPWLTASKDDPMDTSLSYGAEDKILNNGARWRSDETSDEEEDQSQEKAFGSINHTPAARGVRRSRFSKR